MKRTLYNDGVEVDSEDLNNTELTKIDEILITRKHYHFGVIEGFQVAVNPGNLLLINVGKCVFKNGEFFELQSPITAVSGVSTTPGVSTFVGLRLTEVSSNPKPHEVDPIEQNSRATSQIAAELFVAGASGENARQVTLQQAISAELNDGNFILIAEFAGNGAGIDPVPNPLPNLSALSEGGMLPRFGAVPAKTDTARSALIKLYNEQIHDQFPLHSAEDHFHRSVIGSGTPSPRNPHGLTISDIGGDPNLTEHEHRAHSNGLLGFEGLPVPNTDPETGFFNYTPDNGSFAFFIAGTTISVQPITTTDELVINGLKHTTQTFTTVTTLNFQTLFGAVDGFYYLYAVQGEESGNALQVKAATKAFLDDQAVLNGSQLSSHNNIQKSNSLGQVEQPYFLIGLVYWKGTVSEFKDLNSSFTPATFTIPDGAPGTGDLTFRKSLPSPRDGSWKVPAGQARLDLRRYGTISNEQVQKHTIRLDRLTVPVLSISEFDAHSALHATAGTDNTILKHLTDFDALSLFGHRGIGGVTQHIGAVKSSGLLPPTGYGPTDPVLDVTIAGLTAAAAHDDTRYGFQTEYDKWRQDHLTMTMLFFADLQQIQNGEKSIGNAGAVQSGNAFTGGSGGYVIARQGYLTNFGVAIRDKPGGTPGTKSLKVNIYLRPAGASAATSIYNIVNFVNGPELNETSFSDIVIPINAQKDARLQLQVVRIKAPEVDGWKDLTVTCEYHYFY